MPSPRIVACAPWRGRAWALEPWLRAMAGQDRRPDEVRLAINDDEGHSTVSFPDFGEYPKELDEHIEGLTFEDRLAVPELVRPNWPIARLAEMRNELVSDAFTLGADFAWMVDSDIWPEPGALAALLETVAKYEAGPARLGGHPQPLVAAPVRHSENRAIWGFMTGRDKESGEPARCGHESGLVYNRTAFTATLLGAGNCLLIPRTAWEAGIRYGDHPRGEEFPLCAKARELGFRLLVDPRARTTHMMAGPDGPGLRSWE